MAADFEEMVPLADGTRRVWYSRKMPYRDAEGNVVGLLGISRDITDRKAAEDESRAARESAETASKAKDRLLAVVSHELRTPLNPILAMTSYLQGRADLPADLREDISTIRRNVEQEARIVDDLLNVTRLQHGKIVLHQEAVDMHRMLEAVCKPFAQQTQFKAIAFTQNLSAVNPFVWADPNRIPQVLSNLLDNAVKFTPQGGSVTVNCTDTLDHRVRIEISDTGAGIAPEVLPQLFTPFEQGEKSVTRRYGGLELWLVIVKGIVDLHGGWVTPSSGGKDRGATLVLELQAMPAVENQIKIPPGVSTEPRTDGATILLVEDHQDTMRIMRRILISLGYGVLTATSVQEAMQKLASEQFDLLLSDIGLPDGSGLDIMRALRDSKGGVGIALSGFGNDDHIQSSKSAGFTEHLIKPVDLKILETTLKRVVAKAG